jgi:hypothetical protein
MSPRAVAVAQLVEPRVVVPVVAGSSPVRHPPSSVALDARGRYADAVLFSRWLECAPNAPGRIRTCDPRLRRPPLCPLSYRRSLRMVEPRRWQNLSSVKAVVSALLATVAWPLILLGLNLHIH